MRYPPSKAAGTLSHVVPIGPAALGLFGVQGRYHSKEYLQLSEMLQTIIDDAFKPKCNVFIIAGVFEFK